MSNETELPNNRNKNKNKKNSKNNRKKQNENKRLIGTLLSAVIILFAFYVVFTLVHQQVEIADKKAQLEELNNQILIQEVKNDEMKQVNEYDDSENDAYIERVAREEFDYSKKGERVFINVAGE